MIYVYAICDAASVMACGTHGIGDHPVELRAAGGVAAAFSETAAGSIPPTADNIWRHELVVEWLMRDRAVLPARFGTALSDVGDVDDLLARNCERLRAALDRVRGCVELGVRVMSVNRPAPTAPKTRLATGREYLQARLEEERSRRAAEALARQVADRVHGRLTPAAAAGTTRVLPTPEFLMAGAYLVRRGSVERFREAVESVSASEPDLRLLCTGPWAPYHFVPELDVREVQLV